MEPRAIESTISWPQWGGEAEYQALIHLLEVKHKYNLYILPGGIESEKSKTVRDVLSDNGAALIGKFAQMLFRAIYSR